MWGFCTWRNRGLERRGVEDEEIWVWGCGMGLMEVGYGLGGGWEGGRKWRSSALERRDGEVGRWGGGRGVGVVSGFSVW